MGRLRRSRTHKGIKDFTKAMRTRKRTKDLDQIHLDLVPANREKLLTQPEDPDLPGMGAHYCVECSRYFISAAALETHTNSKVHKYRLKELKDAPYTQAEAEAAAGMGSTVRSLADLAKPLTQTPLMAIARAAGQQARNAASASMRA